MSTRSGDDTDTIGNIEEFLQQCLENMEPDHRLEGPGRPRVLPAMALWAGLLVCVLRGFGSQLAVWRLLSERRLWFFPRFPVTDQAVYKRLHSLPTPRYGVRWRRPMSTPAKSNCATRLSAEKDMSRRPGGIICL